MPEKLNSTNILATETVSVDYFSPPERCGVLLMTFSEFGNRKLSGLGFAGKFAMDYGFDLISIKTTSDDWFCGLPADTFSKIEGFIANSALQFRHRALYGSSMGGYAAHSFAADLRAKVALAISPQYDVTRDWDKRWAQASVKKPFPTLDTAHVAPGCRYIAIYDPFNPDGLHADKYAAVIGKQFIPIRLPYSGHPSGPSLASAGVLKSFVFSALTGQEEVIDHRAVVKECQKTHRYKFNLADACMAKKHNGWAAGLMASALADDPFNAEYNISAALIAERRADLRGAIRFAAAAIAFQPKHPHMNWLLGNLLARVGRNPAALHFYDIATSLRPQNSEWAAERAKIAAKL